MSALIAAVLAVGVGLAARNYASDRRTAERLSAFIAQEAAQRVSTALADRTAFLEGLARLPAVRGGDPAGIRAALAPLARGSLVHGVAWTRPGGDVAASAGNAGLGDHAWFARVLATGRPEVGPAVEDPAAPGGGFVVIAVRTLDRAGRPSGVLAGRVGLDQLTGPLEAGRADRDLRLLDGAGQVVAGAGPRPAAPAPPGSVHDGVDVRSGVPGVLGEPDRMVSRAPIAGTSWSAVYQLPEDDALRHARGELGTRVGVWILVALAGIAFAWFLGRLLDRSVRGERIARRRIDLLRRTGAQLAAAVTVQEVTAAAISDQELDAIAVAIYRSRDLPPAAVAGDLPPEAYERLRVQPPLPGGPVATTMASGEPAFLAEAPAEATVSLAGIGTGPRPPAVAALPLRTWSEPTGVMLVAFPEPRPFSADQRALLRALADQTAQALERAIQHEAERARRRRAEMLEGLTTALEREMTVRGRAQLAAELLVPEVADFATIERRDEPGWCVLGLHHRDPALEPALRALRREHRLDSEDARSVAQTVLTGRAQLLSPITPETWVRPEDPRGAALLARLDPTSTLMVPLRTRGHLTGALVLGRGGGREPLAQEDVGFGEELASRLGVALENAQLYEEQREIAVGLQVSLLPERIPELPGNRLAVRYRPGQHHMEVGGDWYDAFELPDGRLALAVGDVVGRGLSAAAAMGRLRTALAALAPGTDRPAALLRRLDAFAESVPGSGLTTLVYAMLNPLTGHLTYASAGHPPGLVVYPDGITHWLWGGRSTPLRAVPDPVRNEAGAELPPGAKLLLYSDGLVERRAERIDAGLDRLAAAARRHHALPPDEFVDVVIGEMDDPEGMGDDLVVVCLEHVGLGGVPADGPASAAGVTAG
ncbi:MAG: SpoIIE family protein phosphatase [Thermoleophilia bacterium]|nr:SpoIIE family protein phosphatase [Thermoleophilia bacterium]